ncbi:F-box only protein 44-like [Anoplolepis gracilipes]|uniref:F-box only protein 44-like n=1 Tax=Anoplolepis gracilipes TaxID=354296 RepID=UPI003BA34A9D
MTLIFMLKIRMERLNHSLIDSIEQSSNKIINANSRVILNKMDCNGLVICNKYISILLLDKIFCCMDNQTLLKCQLVSKEWKKVIKNYWRKKAEKVQGKLFSHHEIIPWHVFYFIYKSKNPFERNLLRNHSGKQGMEHWSCFCTNVKKLAMCREIRVENPPIGVPKLPKLIFEGRQFCFARNSFYCPKIQYVNLIDVGFHPYVLDVLQPPIVINEWYISKAGCPGEYNCQVILKKPEGDVTKSMSFEFCDVIEGERENRWLLLQHVFKNYGPGVRKISFMHCGYDYSRHPSEYNGPKTAGACIYVKMPPITIPA